MWADMGNVRAEDIVQKLVPMLAFELRHPDHIMSFLEIRLSVCSSEHFRVVGRNARGGRGEGDILFLCLR